MFTLTNSIEIAFILTVLVLGFVVPTNSYAQPFGQSRNAPDYCTTSNVMVNNHASQHIDELGNMSPELKHRIFYAFDMRYRLKCFGVCGATSLDWFYLLEDGSYYSKKFPSSGTGELEARRSPLFIWEAVARKFQNTYFKERMGLNTFVQALKTLPKGDHVFGVYYDTNDSSNGHGFVIYKTKHGRLGLLSTHVYPWDLIKLYRQDFLDQLFNSPEFRKGFFEDTSDLDDIQRRYKFMLIGINREGNVTEIAPDTPPGNEGPEGESTDSPEGGE